MPVLLRLVCFHLGCGRLRAAVSAARPSPLPGGLLPVSVTPEMLLARRLPGMEKLIAKQMACSPYTKACGWRVVCSHGKGQSS